MKTKNTPTTQCFLFENLEPITLNNSQKITTRGRFARKYETQEAVNYKRIIKLSLLNEQKEKVSIIKSEFIDGENYLTVDYRFYMPVFTKKGTISKTSKDVDNIVKPIQDAMFDIFEIDDSQIISVSSTKIHSDKPRIEVTVNVKNLLIIK